MATDLHDCCGRINRDLGMLGNKLFLVTMDDYLVAINANTGEVAWENKVADYTDGYTMSGAPLVVNNKS